MRLNLTSVSKVMAIWNSQELPLFNFERLDMWFAWIGHPCEKFWPFEFLKSFRCSISSLSTYHRHQSYTRLKSYGCLNLPRASAFNFECLDVLCAWIEPPIERLWAFEFLESFRCSFSSDSIYHRHQSYRRVQSYGRLNLSRASVFNSECLDIFCAWIGPPSEKLQPFEFL